MQAFLVHQHCRSQLARQCTSKALPVGLLAIHVEAVSARHAVCFDLVKVVRTALCRAQALAAGEQLQAAQFEAAHASAARAQLQSELSAVEAQRQQSQAQSVQAEQLVQQLQVHTTCILVVAARSLTVAVFWSQLICSYAISNQQAHAQHASSGMHQPWLKAHPQWSFLHCCYSCRNLQQ